MDNSYRIIISTSSLNIEDWTDLYRLIDSIYTNGNEDHKSEALFSLMQKSFDIRYLPESNSDVYQLDGECLTTDVLKRLNRNTCFSILYQKNDDTEEFTIFTPFIFFLRRFLDINAQRSLVTLGIGTDVIKDTDKLKSFYFKCSNFFLLYEMPEPVLGKKSLYFYSMINKTTTSLAGKRKGTDYQGNPNRRFLPLLKITEDNYHSIFTTSGNNTNNQSKDYIYVNESFNLIKNKILEQEGTNFGPIANYTDSLFGQWLINGYFNSYEDNELMNMSLDDIKSTIQTLQIYRISIFELIQNIIFHGGKNGLFYCVFDKKENVSSYYQNKLPDLCNKDSKVKRFLRVGIYDYHRTGIVDSFKEREKKAKAVGASETHRDLSLIDFFDTESIATVGVTKLDMRYAASLGIKSFVRTVFKHNGYFSAESNEIINGNNLKKRIISIWKDDRPGFLPESIIEDFAAGTHYEIILPVMPTPSISAPFQRDTFFNLSKTLESPLDSYKPIKVVDLDCNKISSISYCETKEQQITGIKNVGNDIIKSLGSHTDEIALNLNGNIVDHTMMFKILAYIQLNADTRLKKIILINGADNFVSDFCKVINPFLSDITDDEVPVWNKDAAIILISEKLHVQIICGEKKEDLFALNREFEKYYCYNSFPDKANKPFTFTNHNIEYPRENLPGEFLLPYDILIEPKEGTTLFELYALNLLKRPIISNDLGFLVNHENTYIGNKIIVRNYYEADLMFQNSFFAERYAFLIAKNIRKLKRADGKQLVLIGYQQYSEYLIKAIKRSVKDESVHIAIATANDETAKDEISKDEAACNVIANEEIHSVDIDLSFNFDIDGNNKELRDRILKSPDQFQFATIVPIGATLSTNDKIVALFKLWHKLHNSPNRESNNIDFIYNHCVIIVRDAIVPEPTALEKVQQWKEIQFDRHLIRTDFQNATEIHYTIQISKASSTADSSIGNNWLKRLNDVVSFPKEWQCEKYVNFTENSSINSQNLMGFPKVDTRDCDHKEELERLYDFKNYIYKGHFDAFKSHHKHFFDTEAFVRSGNKQFFNWLSKDIKNNSAFNLNNLNIIITPNAETESDLVCAVNDRIFDGNALIVYLDVKNWRNNIVHKLSFIKNIAIDNNNVSFHYVDHILLTGETYHRTKSYLYSINGGKNPIIFDSIITVINRLPYTKGKEIKNDVNHFFAFINLYYPTSKLDGRECELCKLQRYYDDLSKKTVLDSCKHVIKKNVDKLICKSRRELEKYRNKMESQQTNRNFLRLVMTHELLFWISYIEHKSKSDFYLTRIHVFFELDAIYHQLCYGSDIKIKNTIRPITPRSNINNLIDKWFKSKFAEEYSDLIKFHNKQLETDKKIAFLKVISSPPLSRYIIIREYAHSKLLCVLYDILNKKNENNYTYDDLKIVKSILKSLSFLKSNALVRKDVIVGVWKVLARVIKRQKNDEKDIKQKTEKTEKEIAIIVSELESLNSKAQLTLSEGEKRHHLISVLNHKNKYLQYLNDEKDEIEKFAPNVIIKDFSRDVQFFIKNAIVEDDAKATFLGELIRKGEEIHSFDSFSISKTKLSLREDDKKDEVNHNGKNDLFDFYKDEQKYESETFRKEYIDFLVWLFYDNTTIIRKTLDNFSKELKKHNTLQSLFKDGDNLIDIEHFKSHIGSKEQKHSIKNILYEKIKEGIDGGKNYEYYYSSFKPYLDNQDEFDYLEKLIHVTYAKLKLDDLIYHKKGVETDIKDLLNILSEIMDADAAFLTMKYETKSFPMAIFIDNNPKKVWKYDEWLFDDFLTKKYIDLDVLRYPILTFFNISEQSDGERRIHDLGAHSLNLFVIGDQPKQKRVTITFIYKGDNPLTANEEFFRIQTQESGRLLLLLKNEISEYLINYLVEDKVFDLWIEKQKNLRKFEKIYMESNHTFNSVYDEMEEFDKIDPKTLQSLYRTWFFLSNETISFFYSDIERNRAKHPEKKIGLSLGKMSVAGIDNTLGETFNMNFITILSCLLDGYWNYEQETKICKKKNEIYINDQDIHEFVLSNKLINAKVGINKHLLRTFIVQCLNNSLALQSYGGHRPWRIIKRIDIRVSKRSITISDSVSCNLSNSDLKKDISFNMKKNHIKSIDCDEYSSTTLTTLQSVIDYLNSNQEGNNYEKYRCEYSFNKDNNFYVIIKF